MPLASVIRMVNGLAVDQLRNGSCLTLHTKPAKLSSCKQLPKADLKSLAGWGCCAAWLSDCCQLLQAADAATVRRSSCINASISYSSLASPANSSKKLLPASSASGTHTSPLTHCLDWLTNIFARLDIAGQPTRQGGGVQL